MKNLLIPGNGHKLILILNLGHKLIKLIIHLVFVFMGIRYSKSIRNKFVGIQIQSILYSKIGKVFVFWERYSCIVSMFSK